ncbi:MULTISPECIES: helix-hairpin-helix domain-containing protein [unclassified Clostridium]|uniref:helix-hairpin-helix domain-containing protein n=1 Tax=unclassified Clostridium TaxID=2614128 RepID=UPI00110678F0|nr:MULTISPECIES: helix-hairpin-helix domain-containing protein [unclassified Clostridium]
MDTGKTDNEAKPRKMKRITKGMVLGFIILAIFCCQAVYLISYAFTAPQAGQTPHVQAQQGATPTPAEYVWITIAGEVNEPGEYKLKRGCTVRDVVERAGGFADFADVDKRQCKAQLWHDQEVEIKRQNNFRVRADGTVYPFVDGKLNINLGTKQDFIDLDGIGEKTAEKIIAYRSDHYFYSLEELMEVPGMTPKLYEKLMEQVTLDYQDY